MLALNKNVITVAILLSLLLLLAFVATPINIAFANPTREYAIYWFNLCKSTIYHPATSFSPITLVGFIFINSSSSELFLLPYSSALSLPMYLAAIILAHL